MTARALAAILEARLYVSRRLVGYSCAFAVAVALVQPAGAVAAIFCCALVGIIIALDQSVGRHPHLDRCEASAPLFGRELARAKALIPCVAVVVRDPALRGHAARARIARRAVYAAGGAARRRRGDAGSTLGDHTRRLETRAVRTLGMRHGGRGVRACNTCAAASQPSSC